MSNGLWVAAITATTVGCVLFLGGALLSFFARQTDGTPPVSGAGETWSDDGMQRGVVLTYGAIADRLREPRWWTNPVTGPIVMMLAGVSLTTFGMYLLGALISRSVVWCVGVPSMLIIAMVRAKVRNRRQTT